MRTSHTLNRTDNRLRFFAVATLCLVCCLAIPSDLFGAPPSNEGTAGTAMYQESSPGVDGLLSQSTVYVPKDEFDALVMKARDSESSLILIDRINMRVTDEGLSHSGSQRLPVLEIDYVVNVFNRDISQVPLIAAADSSHLSLLSATDDSGPVHLMSEANKFVATVNGSGTHRMKLMFHLLPVSGTDGTLCSLELSLPSAGQVWCQLEMKSPDIQLLKSFGNLEKNLSKSHSGFSTGSFVKDRSRVRLVWSRTLCHQVLDGGTILHFDSPGRLRATSIYRIGETRAYTATGENDEGSAFLVLAKDPLLSISSVSDADVTTEPSGARSLRISEGKRVSYNDCGDFVVLPSLASNSTVIIDYVVHQNCWRGTGSGRFEVYAPLISPVDGTFKAWLTWGNGTVVTPDHDDTILSGADAEDSLLAGLYYAVNPRDSTCIERAYSRENPLLKVKARARKNTSFVGQVSPPPVGFGIYGYEADIQIAPDGEAFLVKETFNVHNMGSPYILLKEVNANVSFISATSRGKRVQPFDIPSEKKMEDTSSGKSLPVTGADTSSQSAQVSLKTVAVPLNFFGTPSQAEKGVVEVVYSVDARSGICPLYGAEYVRSQSKVAVTFPKGWNGTVVSGDMGYSLREYFEDAAKDPAKDVKEAQKPENSGSPSASHTLPKGVRTFALSPVDNVAVGLSAAFSTLSRSGESGDSRSQGPLSSTPGSPRPDAYGTGAMVNGRNGAGKSPVVYISIESPVVGRFRLNIIFLAFCGLLWSFVFEDEKKSTRCFIASTVVLMLALFFGPFDGSILKTIGSAVIVSAIARFSVFILKKSSLERDGND